MRATQAPVAAYRRAGEIGLPRQATASKLVHFYYVPRPRREIRNRHASGELESQTKLAANHRTSRGELILLSLVILFVLTDVGLFTWYVMDLTDQIDRYVSHSIHALWIQP